MINQGSKMDTEKFLKQIHRQAESEGCQELERVFAKCYTNTLDTTVNKMNDGTFHVITGDIPAMWLRDSAAQMRPYIFAAKSDARIREMIAGEIRDGVGLVWFPSQR